MKWGEYGEMSESQSLWVMAYAQMLWGLDVIKEKKSVVNACPCHSL